MEGSRIQPAGVEPEESRREDRSMELDDSQRSQGDAHPSRGGKATAAALLAFCYQEKSIYLETNIRRVLLHYYFHDQTDVHDRVLEAILSELIVLIDDPRSWYYALMDYGVLLKDLVPNPNKRSAHYAKQSRFEGSKRQVRAALLHRVAEQGPIALSSVTEILKEYDSTYLAQSIEELIKEGFLLLEKDSLSIR